VRTVESHVASLLRKLGAADRRELAGLAAVTRPTAAPLNLPAPWTTFMGRERDRAGVLGALRETRLVTLVGPGGVGKTRLAVAVRQEATSAFASGCAFADLLPVREGLVAQAVASVLGVAERPGSRWSWPCSSISPSGRRCSCLTTASTCRARRPRSPSGCWRPALV
jgi:hypothetical protein